MYNDVQYTVTHLYWMHGVSDPLVRARIMVGNGVNHNSNQMGLVIREYIHGYSRCVLPNVSK